MERNYKVADEGNTEGESLKMVVPSLVVWTFDKDFHFSISVLNLSDKDVSVDPWYKWIDSFSDFGNVFATVFCSQMELNVQLYIKTRVHSSESHLMGWRERFTTSTRRERQRERERQRDREREKRVRFFELFFFTLWTLTFMGDGSGPPKINGNQWSRTGDTVLFIPHILLSCENWAASITHNATQPQRVRGEILATANVASSRDEERGHSRLARSASLQTGANADSCYITRGALLDQMQLDSETQIFVFTCAAALLKTCRQTAMCLIGGVTLQARNVVVAHSGPGV